MKAGTALSVVLTLIFTGLLAGQDAKSSAEAAAAKFRDDPNDADALTTYVNESLMAAIGLVASDPRAALKAIDEIEAFMDKAKSDSGGVRSALTRGRALTGAYRKRIELETASLEEVQNRLKASPANETALENYFQKAAMEIAPLANSEPGEAAKKLADVRAFLKGLADSATGEAVANIRRADQGLDQLDQMIEAGRKLAALVGKPAAPLSVKDWVNGKPLTDEDLKGKVVLLDFWAVWCGPCIAGFPHLREWHEKYADKGLVIIGVTQYYNFKWDDDAKSPSRGDQPVSQADEQQMLAKFAEKHELKHRFGVTADEAMTDYYQVSGIPHLVVIDQQGKIRLVRVGTSDENTKAVGDVLAKLLADDTGKRE